MSHWTTSAFLPGTRKSIAWPEACFEGIPVPAIRAPGLQVETTSLAILGLDFILTALMFGD